jgi:hypothetical protein
LADYDEVEKWAEVPSLAATGNGKIHLVWVCGAQAYRCYRFSQDGGQTWSQKERIFGDLLSMAGWDAMVADHQGTLHLIAQLRYPEGMYYAFKPDQGSWTVPMRFVDQPGFLGGHFLSAALTGGNQVFAVWQRSSTDGDITSARITTDAPSLPFQSVPTVLPSATPAESAPTAAVTLESDRGDPTRATVSIDENQEVPLAPDTSPELSLAWGVLPVLALLVVVFGLRLLRKPG